MEHKNDNEMGIYRYLRWELETKTVYLRYSFSNPRLRNQTTQSKYFWNLKDQGLTPQKSGK